MRTPRQHADRNMSNAHNVSAKCPFTPAAFKRRLSSRRENLSNLAKCWRRVSRCKVKWKNPKKSCLHFLKHDPIYRVTSCTFMSAHRLESERRNKRLSMSTQFFNFLLLLIFFFPFLFEEVGENDDWNLPKIENLCSASRWKTYGSEAFATTHCEFFSNCLSVSNLQRVISLNIRILGTTSAWTKAKKA